jgi:hypothetical protein
VQVDVFAVAPARVHWPVVGEYVPLGLETVTVPAGWLVLVMSVTVAVQVLGERLVRLDGVHERAVEVESPPARTIREKVPLLAAYVGIPPPA